MKIKNINYTYIENEGSFTRHLANINLVDNDGDNVMVNAIVTKDIFTNNLELIEIISSSKRIDFSKLYSLIASEQLT